MPRREMLTAVIPAKAGNILLWDMDPRFRGGDKPVPNAETIA